MTKHNNMVTNGEVEKGTLVTYWDSIVKRTQAQLDKRRSKILAKSYLDLLQPTLPSIGFDFKELERDNYCVSGKWHNNGLLLIVSVRSEATTCLWRSDGEKLLVSRTSSCTLDLEGLARWVVDAKASWSSLHEASWNGDIAEVNQLVADYDIDAESHYGLTPLIVATARRHVEVAKLLLEAGVGTETISPGHSITALDVAVGCDPFMSRLSLQRDLRSIQDFKHAPLSM